MISRWAPRAVVAGGLAASSGAQREPLRFAASRRSVGFWIALWTGLRGLADRVEALDGRLAIRSTLGAGTIVTAEMPCGS